MLYTLLIPYLLGRGGDCLVGEVSSVNDDKTDNRFQEERGRYSAIDEDAPILHYLCNEYLEINCYEKTGLIATVVIRRSIKQWTTKSAHPVPEGQLLVFLCAFARCAELCQIDYNQPVLELLTAWIADNVNNLNIKAALCTGDMVDQNECLVPPFRFGNQTSTQQWEFVSRAFNRLDNILPYIISTGNHDYGYTRAERNPIFLSISP